MFPVLEVMVMSVDCAVVRRAVVEAGLGDAAAV